MKILVAVDGSEESMLAADCAIDMAKKNNAELIALNVIHSQNYLYSPAYALRPVIPSTTNSIIQNQEEEAQLDRSKIMISLSVACEEDFLFCLHLTG